MFIDASAFCGVLLCEPDADILGAKIVSAQVRLTSALATYETVLALSRFSGNVAAAKRDVDAFLLLAGVEVVPIGAAEQAAALEAFDRFGKGRHPAKLNMGDCFAYACARTHGVPLLFKGDDFSRTDVEAA